MATPIVTDGTTDRVVDAPRTVPPAGAALFAERAARFEQLAAGEALGPYLRLMGAVARAQAGLFGARPASVVAAAAIASAKEYGMPPLAATSHVRAASWRDDLAALLAEVSLDPAAVPAHGTLRALSSRSSVAIEEAADRLLAGTSRDEEAAEVPFLGAALQLHFTRMAATLDRTTLEACDVPNVCPACGMRPVASVVRIGADRGNRRYLCCALCHTEWHLPRITCTTCGKDKAVQYFGLEGAAPSARQQACKAEACDDCGTYLKIFHQDRDAQVDPCADDLATLALDVLVDERGYARSGPNLLFHPGSG